MIINMLEIAATYLASFVGDMAMKRSKCRTNQAGVE